MKTPNHIIKNNVQSNIKLYEEAHQEYVAELKKIKDARDKLQLEALSVGLWINGEGKALKLKSLSISYLWEIHQHLVQTGNDKARSYIMTEITSRHLDDVDAIRKQKNF